MNIPIIKIMPGAAPKLVSAAADQACEICGRTDLTAVGLKRHLHACQRKHGGTSASNPVARPSDSDTPPVALASHQYRIHPSIPAAGAAVVAELYGELYGVQEQFWPDIRICAIREFGSFLHPENRSRVIPAAAQRERAQRQFDEHRTRER